VQIILLPVQASHLFAHADRNSFFRKNFMRFYSFSLNIQDDRIKDFPLNLFKILNSIYGLFHQLYIILLFLDHSFHSLYHIFNLKYQLCKLDHLRIHYKFHIYGQYNLRIPNSNLLYLLLPSARFLS
jgi:hypothetical protein